MNLRIGIVCYPTHGGSGVVAVELAHALAEDGMDVHLISYDLPSRLDTLKPGITFHSVNVPDYPLFEYPPYSLALAAKLEEVIEDYQLDVLHVHYAIPHAVSAILARIMSGRFRMPVVTTLHGTDITIVGNDPSYLPITRFSLGKSQLVTVVSHWLGKKVKEIIQCECDYEVIHNFVDSEKYKPQSTCAIRKRFGLGNKPVLMHMSNFRPVKRIEDVVEVFLRVRAQMDVSLVMVGNGPLFEYARRRLKESPFSTDAHLLGLQDQAEQILPGADLFLLPSVAESFGLVALEAMACGVPVIGANAGGLTEVVEDGVTGALCSPAMWIR